MFAVRMWAGFMWSG